MATGEEAGVLGLLKTWEEKGEVRFQKHIETQKWYKQDKVDSDREEVRRLNELKSSVRKCSSSKPNEPPNAKHGKLSSSRDKVNGGQKLNPDIIPLIKFN